jgi:hypothetical protein
LLVEDWYLKRCFIDHFFNGEVDFDTFRTGVFREDGDFVLEPYQYAVDAKSGQVRLWRDGRLWRPEGVADVSVVKQFDFDSKSGKIEVVYDISTSLQKPVTVSFAVENSFNMQAGHDQRRYILINGERHPDSFLDSAIAYEGVKSFAMLDQARDIGLTLAAETTGDIWHLPIFTVSLSEGGFEKVYQGTTFVNRYALKLSRDPVRLKFTLVAGTVADVLSSRRLSSVAKE